MSTADFQPIPGMSDLAPPDIRLWQRIERQARHLFPLYGFEEIRTPILESTGLFLHSLGDTTEVVQKEMYTFQDRGGRSLTLRPEGTAGVIRYVAGQGPEALAGRYYYWGPMFRSERPQAGRRRQFHQVGVEALGPPNPAADAEVLALQMHLLSEWGLAGAEVHLNTRGVAEDGQAIAEGLRAALRPMRDRLCDDCRRRFDENVLRILDCKNPACQSVVEGLPATTSFMSEASRSYLDEVQRVLQRLEIKVRLNPRLVRGLDYYVHTVWEITHSGLGAQDAISGGGRYQIQIGEKTIEGVGFAMGLERIVTALGDDAAKAAGQQGSPLVWIISLGQPAFAENILLAQSLRLRGIRCGLDLNPGSMKAQMRAANRAGANRVVIRGDQEMEKGLFLLKDMTGGAQDEVDMPELINRLAPLRALT